jgi:hypothetical protein
LLKDARIQTVLTKNFADRLTGAHGNHAPRIGIIDGIECCGILHGCRCGILRRHGQGQNERVTGVSGERVALAPLGTIAPITMTAAQAIPASTQCSRRHEAGAATACCSRRLMLFV